MSKTKTRFDEVAKEIERLGVDDEMIRIYKRESDRVYKLTRLCITIMGIAIIGLIFSDVIKLFTEG